MPVGERERERERDRESEKVSENVRCTLSPHKNPRLHSEKAETPILRIKSMSEN